MGQSQQKKKSNQCWQREHRIHRIPMHSFLRNDNHSPSEGKVRFFGTETLTSSSGLIPKADLAKPMPAKNTEVVFPLSFHWGF